MSSPLDTACELPRGACPSSPNHFTLSSVTQRAMRALSARAAAAPRWRTSQYLSLPPHGGPRTHWASRPWCLLRRVSPPDLSALEMSPAALGDPQSLRVGDSFQEFDVSSPSSSLAFCLLI